MSKEAKKADAELEEEIYQQTLASFSPGKKPEVASDSSSRVEALKDLKKQLEKQLSGSYPTFAGGVDLPIAVGKPR